MQDEKDVRQDKVLKAIRILRDVTVIVKIFPFLSSLLYIIFFLAQLLFQNDVVYEMESLFYISAFVVVLLIVLSYRLRLCKWHRIQCLLLLMPHVFSYIDMYVYEYGVHSAIIADIALTFILAVSILNAYKMFRRSSSQTSDKTETQPSDKTDTNNCI